MEWPVYNDVVLVWNFLRNLSDYQVSLEPVARSALDDRRYGLFQLVCRQGILVSRMRHSQSRIVKQGRTIHTWRGYHVIMCSEPQIRPKPRMGADACRREDGKRPQLPASRREHAAFFVFLSRAARTAFVSAYFPGCVWLGQVPASACMFVWILVVVREYVQRIPRIPA